MARHAIQINEPKTMGEYLAIFTLCFYVFTALVFRISALKNSYLFVFQYNVIDICECVTFAFAVAAIAMRPRKLPIWKCGFLVVALSALFISGNRLGNYRFALECILLISIAGIDMKRVCRAYCITALVALLLIMFASLIGLVSNMDVIPNSRLVFSYGFTHPNTPGALLFSILAAMAYTLWDKKTWMIPAVMSLVGAVFAYAMLSSHASAVILVLLALAIFIGHVKSAITLLNDHRIAVCAVLIAIPMLALAVMLVCTACYDANNPFFAWINALAHGRPYYAHHQYEMQGGFSYLGTPTSFPDSYHTGIGFGYVDSGYCHLALIEGLSTLVVFVVIYVFGVIAISKKGLHPLVAALFIIDALFLIIEICPLLLPESVALLFIAEFYAGEQVEECDKDISCSGGDLASR